MATGGPGFNRTARVMLFEMRWRKPPPEHGLRIFAWFISITMHLVFAVLMLLARPTDVSEPPGGSGDESAIEVRLIEQEQTPPPPPPPTLRLPKRVPRKGTVAHAPRQGAVSVPKVVSAELPAIPKVEQPRIETHVTVARPRVAPTAPAAPTVTVVPPSKLEAQVEQAPPPRPSPPRVVAEPSPMALPPPKVTQPKLTVVAPSSPDLEPVPVSGAEPRTQAPQVRVDIADVSRPAPAAMTPAQVSVAPAETPMQPVPVAPAQVPTVQPDIATAPIAAAPTPTVQPPHISAPVVAPEPTAPIPLPAQASPRVEAPEVHPPQLPAALPEAAPGPLSAPEVTVSQPAAPSTVAAPSKPTVQPAPATSTSWAQSSAADRFSTPTEAAPHAPGKVQLYGKQGSLALTGGQGPGKVPDYIQRRPQGNSDVMGRRTSRITYTPTRFDQYWVPYGQSSLDTLLERLIDKLTVTKKIDLPNGIHGECKFSPLLFVAVIGCGANPPPIPTAASNDPRLNMAPAKPLAPDLGPAKSAPTPPAQTLPKQDQVSCAMAKVSGSPPPPGCPGGGAASDQW